MKIGIATSTLGITFLVFKDENGRFWRLRWRDQSAKEVWQALSWDEEL